MKHLGKGEIDKTHFN